MPVRSLRAALLAALIACAPAAALADSYTFPNRNPTAVITVPDDWEVEEIARGIEITSEDEELFITIEAIDEKDIEKTLTNAVSTLISQGLKPDTSTQKMQEITVNGMKGVALAWDGKDEDDSATQLGIMVINTGEGKAVLITSWGSEAAQKENMRELTEMLNSLKPVK